MRTLTSGLALALVGGLLIAPLGAAESRRQDGVIAGSAAAEAKQPYSNYIIRAPRREHQQHRADDDARRERPSSR